MLSMIVIIPLHWSRSQASSSMLFVYVGKYVCNLIGQKKKYKHSNCSTDIPKRKGCIYVYI